jgi:hypothetical protein
VDEQRLYSTEYDALHRPTAQWLRINGEARQMVERFDYRDTRSADGAANPRASEDRHANLLGQLVRHYDSSGLVETVRRDFKGNVLETRRTLARAYDALVVDWSPGSHTTELETETFAQITEYDALNRMTRQYNWHKVIPDSRVAVYEPRYNARGLLASEDLFIRAVKKPEGYEGGQRTSAIRSIAYDAKGQKERIDYGNGTITRYDYARPAQDLPNNSPVTTLHCETPMSYSSSRTPTTPSATSRRFTTRPTNRSSSAIRWWSRAVATPMTHSIV